VYASNLCSRVVVIAENYIVFGDTSPCSFSDGCFDYIVTCDTLYSPDLIPSLFNLIEKLLVKGGIALIASKRYYFGVGGSTQEFMQISKTNGMSCRVAQIFADGSSNVREILQLIKP